MTKSILVVSTHKGSGLTSAVLGLYHALERQGMKVGFHKPVLQYSNDSGNVDFSSRMMAQYCRGRQDETLSIRPEKVQKALDTKNVDELMEFVIQQFDAAKGDADIVVMEGLLETPNVPYANGINQKIARALSADVVFVTSAQVPTLSRLEHRLDFSVSGFGGYERDNLLGAIVNHVGGDEALDGDTVFSSQRFGQRFKLLGMVPARSDIASPRVLDLQRHFDAEVLIPGEMETRRVRDYVMFARTVPNAIEFLKPNYCIFSPGDRDDTLMAVTISATAGNHLACLILTGTTSPSEKVMKLCRPLLKASGLPVLQISTNSWKTARAMDDFNHHIPNDDVHRIQHTKEFFAEHIKSDWVDAYLTEVRASSISPAAFRYNIVQQAVAADKTIVLPEGDEPRTVVAASQCAERGMARCVLLANPDSVRKVAKQQGVSLGDNISIIDPEAVRDKYLDRLVELRGHKGMNETLARSQLEDNVVLGTMMLEAGEVDGLVSGAVHTTANTIRPPLQIIKTAPGASVVSSVFFMCLPDQVLVYGDCAIIPNPDVDELAQIAIQSHDTAKAFGVDPKVAMISYSTGTSGAGEDVQKVKAATDKVRELRPDILVDGPLQYDAAAIASVGEKKAPNSPVAGRATVFIFPDLNTGNTTYKAVQRSANAISMGPVLQGMRKPVNDLSRGALIDDILYTIAITAVQAQQAQDRSNG
ncbi:phosphate acetyltransferase [Suttonella sp. R2A3]|uniref:phosphate acetyltransferase n=1 Tax=Suttonella sp. R2A3 TaxID=2908648 RepID=UPI001F174AC4|nr:phosphate acetyltransferase [Suttonella sp. R2A3]UJF23992.1 phosphate acetyltransferase [Suttonella sp. R2A3]